MTTQDGSRAQDDIPTVRLFSGWADSAIWFSSPVSYSDTRLDQDLIDDLRRWDNGFYAARKPDYEWHNPDDAAQYYQVGTELARRLAEQIGHDFQVRYDVGDGHRYVRASGDGDNRAAAAAFRRMNERMNAEQARMREIVDRATSEGHSLYWSADPPTNDQEASVQAD